MVQSCPPGRGAQEQCEDSKENDGSEHESGDLSPVRSPPHAKSAVSIRLLATVSLVDDTGISEYTGSAQR